MKLSLEAKVGFVSIAAGILLLYMIVYLGNFSFGEKGYQIQAVFKQVDGLKQGNVLRYAGVDVGEVKEIAILPDNITVTFLVNPGVKIPEGAKFRIGSDGLVGEKHINIVPPTNTSGFLSPNTTVKGEEVMSMDDLIASSSKVMNELHQLVKSLNEVIGDEKVKESIKETVIGAKEIANNLNVMSAALARMAQNNEGNVNAMISNLNVMSATLRDVAARVDKMLLAADNDGQTVQDLRDTIENIKNASARVEKIAAALDGVITDPETAKNIKETLRNARSVSEKANTMLTKVNSISTKTGVEVLYSGGTGKYKSNLDLRVDTSPQDFAIIGVNDIGSNSKGNFQIGKGSEEFASRAGIIDSKLGVGIDTKLGKQLKLSVDMYDPNDFRIKLRTQYQLAPDTFIVGQTDSINKRNDTTTYLGVRKNF